MSEKKAISIVKGFIEKYISRDITTESIDKLVTFDFFNLWAEKDIEFGYQGIQYQPICKFDGDRTNLANAIYFLVYPYLPGKNKERIEFDEILCGNNYLDKCLYSGDTLNTFATLFSYRSLDENIFNDKDLYEAIKKFKRKYETIGNFMLLPKISIGKTSINSHRGMNKWHDYYDIFLFELEKCMQRKSDCDKILLNLIDKNSFYFNSKLKFQDFINNNLLTDYYDFSKNKVKSIFSESFSKQLMYSDSEKDFSEYKKFALNYVSNATSIIEKRAERIAGILKSNFASNALYR